MKESGRQADSWGTPELPSMHVAASKMRSIAASSGFSLLLRTRNRRHQIRSLSRRPWKSDSSSACQPWVFVLEMASLVTNQPPLTINGHILGWFKMIQHGDSSPSDPKKLAVSVYSPARATHLGLRFGVFQLVGSDPKSPPKIPGLSRSSPPMDCHFSL